SAKNKQKRKSNQRQMLNDLAALNKLDKRKFNITGGFNPDLGDYATEEKFEEKVGRKMNKEEKEIQFKMWKWNK
ncbi:hypothetical protein H4219_005608, partial [Mycoemilia scoparia]